MPTFKVVKPYEFLEEVRELKQRPTAAALALIEEHGGSRLSPVEVSKTYLRADRLLKDTQDKEDIARLRACARVALRRLSGARLHDKNFTFYGAVQDFEAIIIEQALEESGGSVTRAAKLRH